MTTAVLDASAVLALLFSEPGADVVRPRMRGGLISTVNLAEVLAKLVDKGVPAEDAARAVDMLGMEPVPLSVEQAQLSPHCAPRHAQSACRSATAPASPSLAIAACGVETVQPYVDRY